MECPVCNEKLQYSSRIGWYCEECGFNHKDSESESKPHDAEKHFERDARKIN